MHHLHHQLIRKRHQSYAAITNRAKAKPLQSVKDEEVKVHN